MILVAIGANLPDRAGRSAMETCVWATAQLTRLAPVECVSRWYRTAPDPPSDQPDYINGVARLHGTGEPRDLLAALHHIEAAAGRVRGAVNAARVLDLDLLAVDSMIIDTPDLVVPHPRLARRAFVLAPLCDVAPEWCHPVLDETAADLLANLSRDGVSLALQHAVD